MSARGATRVGVLSALVIATLAAGLYAGIRERWFRAPFPAFGKRIAWLVGDPEAAYNFGPVVEGRVFRSSEPDARFLDYLRREHRLERIVALDGEQP